MGKRATNSRRSPGNKVRYAIVGLGYYGQKAGLPGFEHASRNSKLVAIVSGDEKKIRQLTKKYDIELAYGYEDYEDCLRSGEIDAVYIALPNHMHHEYAIRAANAGIHVLCEKPMAVTERQCQEMIQAARNNKVKLMIGYRLHFEEANLSAIEVARSGKIGEPRLFSSVFAMQVEEGNIRLNSHDLGGGTVYDIGIYCINAARYLFSDEPLEVFAYSANNGEDRFKETEEMTGVVMRFPGERVASFICTFNGGDVSSYQIIGTKGDLRVDPAYESAGDLKHYLTVNGKTREKVFKNRDQFAAELVYFSDCILNNKQPEPSGKEGLIDVRIIRAIYRSAATGKPVQLAEMEKEERPDIDQEIQKPPAEKVELVNAEPPSGKD